MARDVSSPTYTLEHEYRLAAERCIDHWDLYRVATLPEELFEPPAQNIIRVVEWPERCPEIAADLDLHISIQLTEGAERIVSFDGVRAAALEPIVSLRVL
jgi:tRNA A37 threonylcarbamoyladenosine biosynthesis protein TsaE